MTDSNQSFAQQVCFGAACDCTTFTGTAGGPCPGNGVAYECTIGVNGGGASGPGTVIGWHNPGDPHSCACDFSYTYCPARGYTFVTVDTQYRPCE